MFEEAAPEAALLADGHGVRLDAEEVRELPQTPLLTKGAIGSLSESSDLPTLASPETVFTGFDAEVS